MISAKKLRHLKKTESTKQYIKNYFDADLSYIEQELKNSEVTFEKRNIYIPLEEIKANSDSIIYLIRFLKNMGYRVKNKKISGKQYLYIDWEKNIFLDFIDLLAIWRI